jgi:DNA-binding CsgD family transcriptional regulator
MRRRALLPAEARVAKQVAAGRSVSDVAAALGLPRKAVEWHLSSACRKLGVRSRAELAAALAEPAPERGRPAVP